MEEASQLFDNDSLDSIFEDPLFRAHRPVEGTFARALKEKVVVDPFDELALRGVRRILDDAGYMSEFWL